MITYPRRLGDLADDAAKNHTRIEEAVRWIKQLPETEKIKVDDEQIRAAVKDSFLVKTMQAKVGRWNS
jgi:type II secretory pathway component PulM